MLCPLPNHFGMVDIRSLSAPTETQQQQREGTSNVNISVKMNKDDDSASEANPEPEADKKEEQLYRGKWTLEEEVSPYEPATMAYDHN